MPTDMNLNSSQVAGAHSNLRATDSEPIDFIADKLEGEERLIGADVGCGDGRYSLMLYEALGRQFSLYCCDKSSEMLLGLKVQFQKKGIQRFTMVNSPSEKIPLKSEFLNVIFTFNAVHNFKLDEFLPECARLLKDNGQLFVYTRLAEQNNESIWGKYFPGFLEKESLLYKKGVVEKALSQVVALELLSATKFPYKRTATLERLAQLVKQRHYSTFSLYSPEELKSALTQFKVNIRKEFSDTSNIQWEDENIMYHITNHKQFD